jgi:hypothetical protein
MFETLIKLFILSWKTLNQNNIRWKFNFNDFDQALL